MRQATRQSGFTLIASIFLLVVVAALIVYITSLRVVQQTTLVYGVQGARGLQAARSGIEWGIHQSIVNGSCAASTSFTPSDPALADFTIEVQCGSSVHTEGVTPITTYRLTAIARAGSYGSLDFVQRRLRATVSLDPP